MRDRQAEKSPNIPCCYIQSNECEPRWRSVRHYGSSHESTDRKLKVHRLKAMGSGDTNMLGRLKPAFAVAQTAAFRRRPFGGSGPFGTS